MDKNINSLKKHIDQITYDSETRSYGLTRVTRTASNDYLQACKSEFEPEIAFLTARCAPGIHESCYVRWSVVKGAVMKFLADGNIGDLDMPTMEARFTQIKSHDARFPDATLTNMLSGEVAQTLVKEHRQNQLAANTKSQNIGSDAQQIKQKDMANIDGIKDQGQSLRMEFCNDRSEKKVVNVEVQGVKIVVDLGYGESIVVKKRKYLDD